MGRSSGFDLGIAVLSSPVEEKLAQHMGVSIEEVMAKKRKTCPPVAKSYARKLMSIAISAATKAAVLRRRGILSPDTENTTRKIVGDIGVFLGKGRFEATLTTLMTLGEEDRILATCIEGRNARRPTKKLLSELLDDLVRLRQGGKELQMIIPRSGVNFLIEPNSCYISIAAYIGGLSETATSQINSDVTADEKRRNGYQEGMS